LWWTTQHLSENKNGRVLFLLAGRFWVGRPKFCILCKYHFNKKITSEFLAQ
jgi:hypothetical protein